MWLNSTRLDSSVVRASGICPEGLGSIPSLVTFLYSDTSLYNFFQSLYHHDTTLLFQGSYMRCEVKSTRVNYTPQLKDCELAIGAFDMDNFADWDSSCIQTEYLCKRPLQAWQGQVLFCNGSSVYCVVLTNFNRYILLIRIKHTTYLQNKLLNW